LLNLDKALTLLKEFIRINTSNPPGNEEEAILFLDAILHKEGIPAEIFSPTPRRANILATIKGKRRGKPIVLLGHVDTVPAREDDWEVDPFGGEIKDDFIYGRGTIDMKSQIICQLLSFIHLYKRGVTPEQDIVFLATCDEEVGGEYGVKYVIDKVPELKDASFVLSEGGCITDEDGLLHAQISVDEKKLSQFMIVARGTGGHGSLPHKDNANEKIVTASNAILSYNWPFIPTRVVAAYLNGILKGKRGNGFVYTTLHEALKKKAFRNYVQRNPVYNALLRNTVTLTILKGGEKVNVIPTESHATFDARLLPAQRHEDFFRIIKKLCGNQIELRPINDNTNIPQSPQSPYKTRYFKAISKVVKAFKGQIPVLPFLTTGATDLRYFRNLGIVAYGFFPVTLPKEESLRMHGVNERISIENLKEGLEGTYRIVESFASSI